MRKVVPASLVDKNIWLQCVTTGWLGADGYFVPPFFVFSAHWAGPISEHIRTKWTRVPKSIKHKNTWLLYE
jgi:hypothetical protein